MSRSSHAGHGGSRLIVGSYLPLLFTMITWGSAFSFSRLALQHIGPFPAAMLRYGLAAIVLLAATAIAERGVPRIPAGMGRRLFLGGLVGVAIYNGIFFFALSLAPAVDGAAIMPVTSPIATAAMALVVSRERPRPLRLLALAIGVAGAAIYLWSVWSAGPDPAHPYRLVGDLLFLFTASLWGVYTLMGRSLMAAAGPARVTAWTMASGAVILAVVAFPQAIQTDWAAQPLDLWLEIAYLGIVPTALGYALYYRGVRDVGPTTAVVLMFLIPVVGILGATLILGDRIGGLQLLGSATMAAGAFLAILSTTPGLRPPRTRPRGAAGVG